MRILLYLALYLIIGWMICGGMIKRNIDNTPSRELWMTILTWAWCLLIWLPLMIIGLAIGIYQLITKSRS